MTYHTHAIETTSFLPSCSSGSYTALGSVPDSRVTLEESGCTLGGSWIDYGDSTIPARPFIVDAIKGNWIVAAVDGTDIKMVMVQISVSSGAASACALDAGYATAEGYTTATMTYPDVRTAWNTRADTYVATYIDGGGYGVTLAYSIQGNFVVLIFMLYVALVSLNVVCSYCASTEKARYV